MNEDDIVSASLMYDELNSVLNLAVRAKRAVVLTEVQGDRGVLEAFGAMIPEGFRVLQFGEGTEVPEGMKADIEFMNKSQFRWASSIAVAAGGEYTICFPASGGAGRDNGVLTLAYEYPKLFGLLKGKGAIYVSLTSR